MPECSAIACTNRNEKGIRTFRFPKNAERRSQWLLNMRRDSWTPSNAAVLCEKHFESFHFEENRQDGCRKLKPNAVPTLFNMPNVSRLINRPPRKSIRKNIPKQFHAVTNTIAWEWNEVLDDDCNFSSDASFNNKTSISRQSTSKHLENKNNVCAALRRENALLRDQLQQIEFANDVAMKKDSEQANDPFETVSMTAYVCLQRERDDLQKQLNHLKLQLKKILNEDQISALQIQ